MKDYLSTRIDLRWSLADGTRMYAWRSDPEDAQQVQGVVGIVHGMGEHSGRYEHVAAYLNHAGYAVITFDQRGHGRTVGDRGHTPSYDALLEGIDRLVQEADHYYPGLPFFLYGHSMGGNTTLNYLLRRRPQIAGAVVSGPWLELAFKPPLHQLAAARVASVLYPTYTSQRPMKAEDLTADLDMQKRYLEDPLGHGQITAGFFCGVQKAGLWALANATRLQVPLLLMHGGADQVTSIAASRRFAERAGELCEFMEWPGMKHELHNETDRSIVSEAVLKWLNGRLQRHS
ncbi:alpha/beta hydrolase [Gorillibacterium timonense]|uniref:alpha/beta hydrolase n=1 Tax=Gorillibacterium timonense TaxID=1689269 RepID=UPI00071E25BE|nr:alpha/beta hydrolase [Gorillibacterium timonense]